MKNKKKKIMRIINIIIFILVAFLTFYIIFKKNDIFLIIKNLKQVKIIYIIIACLLMFFYIACEGINIKRILKTLNNKITFLSSFKYASVGFFFSAITPSASGGDPMQLYFMKKDGLPLTHSALALLVELASFEIICCIFAVLGYIYNYNIITNHIGKIKYLVILGIILNILYVLLLLIMIFSKKTANKIVKIITKLLSLIHYKKIDAFTEKAQKQIEEYHNCSLYIKKNKFLLLKTILTTIVELIAYHCIPFCIYLAFGLGKYNVASFLTMSAILYTSVAFIPLPGAMGASEGSFIILYKMFFPAYLLSSSMLISRAVSYYLFVIITGLMILGYIIKTKIIKKHCKNLCKKH